MKKKNKLLLGFLIPVTFCTYNLNASKGSNITANYSGNTGIFETPNARIMPDWSMRMFVNKDRPFTYYGFAITPLPFLETNFHITEVSNVSNSSKDTSVSFKLLLQEEGLYLPSVVFGGNDIWGTGLYTSKYIAMSKNIGYFDFTLGYAKGRLGGKQINTASTNGSSDNNAFDFMKKRSWSGGKPFGSIVFNATPSLSLMAEYSPINYEKDTINPFSNGSKYDLPDSKINLGAKYTLNNNSLFNLSFQRGNQISLGYSYQFSFSKIPMISDNSDTKREIDLNEIDKFQNLNEKQLSNKFADLISKDNLSNVQTSVNQNKIWFEFENKRYNNDIKAIGRSISSLDAVAPKKYDTLYATLKEHDLPLKTIKINRQEYNAYENGKVSHNYIKNATIMTNSVEEMEKEFKNQDKNTYKTEKYRNDKFSYSIEPDLKTYLNTKNKSISAKFSAAATMNYDISEGVFVSSKILHPLYNNIKSNSSVETNKLSTHSSMLDYDQYNSTQLDRLTVDYIFNAPFNALGKVEFGYLDSAFAGIDMEWYKSFNDEKIGFGLQYQHVYKRPVNNMLEIYDDLTYDAKFLNAHYLLSDKYNMYLGLKIGQFLAGDKGIRVDFSRNYKGLTIGAFATITDSDDIFTSNQNKDYIDKGIYMKIPFSVFGYKNKKGKIDYGISSYKREVGQVSNTTFSLYPMNNSENNIQMMKKNIQKIIE